MMSGEGPGSKGYAKRLFLRTPRLLYPHPKTRQAAFWLLHPGPNEGARLGGSPINQSSGIECQQGLDADKGCPRGSNTEMEIG